MRRFKECTRFAQVSVGSSWRAAAGASTACGRPSPLARASTDDEARQRGAAPLQNTRKRPSAPRRRTRGEHHSQEGREQRAHVGGLAGEEVVEEEEGCVEDEEQRGPAHV